MTGKTGFRGRVALAMAAAAALAVAAAGPAPRAAGKGWAVIDYGPLVDRDRTTQSGETVGVLLEALGGRDLPPPGERPEDFGAHRLLEPILERYAFVLSDVADTVEPPPPEPWVEVAALWHPGEAQPAWVDLLRSRRFVLESDGRGRIRAFVPGVGSDEGDSAGAAERAWRDAWPVLRHPLGAERRRLAGGSSGEIPDLRVEVHAYRHRPALARFELGLEPFRATVGDTRSTSGRPPLDLEALGRVLRSPVSLEGGRLEPDGAIRWFTSEADAPATLLGEPMDLSDAAVAYRAVFHGGLAEPYMSLDKGESPWTAAVGFGGRLRDTRLGTVSLLSDIRFKTFSVGIDPLRGEDLRREIRTRLDQFRTHLERFASDADSAEVGGQQTRFWFYPDHVEFALSPQADVFAIRSARMSAASERVRLGERLEAAGEDPPWTRGLVAFLNDEYEPLSRLFPELADLDRTVRLLSAFAWLETARDSGRTVPDLDVLLALELPPVPTPRTFPQLLTRDVLPTPGVPGPVDVLDQSWVGEALDRLLPRTGRLAPEERYRRALDLLDPRDREQAALAAQIHAAEAAGGLGERDRAAWAERADRVAMHRRVLSFAPAPSGPARVFSVGIGGIDLGTSSAFARASRRGGGLTSGRSRDGAATQTERVAAGGAVPPSPGTPRDDPPGLSATVMRDHGLAGAARREVGGHLFARGVWAPEKGDALAWTETRLGSDGPDVLVRRRVQEREGRPAVFVRVEEGRTLSYRFERDGGRFVPVAAVPAIPASAFSGTTEPSGSAEIPPGLAVLEFLPRRTGEGSIAVGPGVAPSDDGTVPVRRRLADGKDLAADLPRPLLRRLVLGPRLDPAGSPPIPLFSSPPSLLAGAETLLVLLREELSRPPWDGPFPTVPGEEDAVRVAAAIGALWAEAGTNPAAGVAVATDPLRSPGRWASAPEVSGGISLVLPSGAFPAGSRSIREALVAAWPEGRTVAEIPPEGSLVVVASAEAPGVLSTRLRGIARSPEMKGRLLAVCALGGPLRPDLPRSLLDEGNLAGIALLEPSAAGGRRAARELGEWARALPGSTASRRVETVAGPLVWSF